MSNKFRFKHHIIAKPWQPRPDNALGGQNFVVFLENLGPEYDA
jgi:hypothetical protein